MRYDHYWYPIVPGERGYTICGLDVDRFQVAAGVEADFQSWLERRKELDEMDKRTTDVNDGT